MLFVMKSMSFLPEAFVEFVRLLNNVLSFWIEYLQVVAEID